MGRWITHKIRVMLLIALLCAAALGVGGLASAFGPGAQGADVYAVQAMLQSLGYYTGTIDGVYGGVTSGSVAAYQRSAGMGATGEVDTNTFRSILQAYARAKVAASGTGPESTGGQASSSGGAGAVFRISAEEQQMMDLVNAARAEANLPPLSAHAELSRVARFKSEDMAANGYFSHDSPTYGSPFQMMNDFGLSFGSAGENIACNQSVEKAHEALMNSPGHRANIMSTDFTAVGIGVVSGGPCGSMYTQMFLRP